MKMTHEMHHHPEMLISRWSHVPEMKKAFHMWDKSFVFGESASCPAHPGGGRPSGTGENVLRKYVLMFKNF